MWASTIEGRIFLLLTEKRTEIARALGKISEGGYSSELILGRRRAGGRIGQ